LRHGHAALLKRELQERLAQVVLVRFHKTIRCTPAMEAGVASSPMTVADLVDMAA